jgi:Protein of unknown function (DUF2892).
MKMNMGTIDRVVRILVALVFAGLYLANVVTGTLGIILLVLAVVFVVTSFIGFCPLYWPVGINTGAKKD